MHIELIKRIARTAEMAHFVQFWNLISLLWIISPKNPLDN